MALTYLDEGKDNAGKNNEEDIEKIGEVCRLKRIHQ